MAARVGTGGGGDGGAATAAAREVVARVVAMEVDLVAVREEGDGGGESGRVGGTEEVARVGASVARGRRWRGRRRRWGGEGGGLEVVMEAVVTVVAVTAAARGVDLAERRCCLCRRPSCCRSRAQQALAAVKVLGLGAGKEVAVAVHNTSPSVSGWFVVCRYSIQGTWHVCVEARNLLSETWIVDELEHERRRSHRIVARTVGVEIVRDAGVLPVR